LSERQIRKLLLKEYKSWKGTPHRMGGIQKKVLIVQGLFIRFIKEC